MVPAAPWPARTRAPVATCPCSGPSVGAPTYHDLVLPDGHHGRAVSQSFELEPDDPRQRLTVVVAAEIENLEEFESRIHRLLLVDRHRRPPPRCC